MKYHSMQCLDDVLELLVLFADEQKLVTSVTEMDVLGVDAKINNDEMWISSRLSAAKAKKYSEHLKIALMRTTSHQEMFRRLHSDSNVRFRQFMTKLVGPGSGHSTFKAMIQCKCVVYQIGVGRLRGGG